MSRKHWGETSSFHPSFNPDLEKNLCNKCKRRQPTADFLDRYCEEGYYHYCIGCRIRLDERELFLDRKNSAMQLLRSNVPERKANPCWVCGRYKHITQMHHVIPVSKAAKTIAEIGADKLDLVSATTCIWLCPNHHTILHAIKRGNYVPFGECDENEVKQYQKIEQLEKDVAELFFRVKKER